MSRLHPTGPVLSSLADLDAPPCAAVSGVSRAPEGAMERALCALLPVRERAEMERLVAEVVAEAAGAGWAALYRSADGVLELRAVHPRPKAELTQSIPEEAVEAAGLGRAAALGRIPRELGPLLPADAQLALPLDLGEHGWTLVLLGPHASGLTYGEAHLAVVRRVLECCGVALGNVQVVEHLRSLVFVDPLTGCYNRRGMEEHLRVEVVRARRYRRPLSLLLLDLDHFKRINDVLGHGMGDHALRRVGEAILKSFRATDLACRFGGDEFLVIFPETSKHEVLRLADRLRARIAALLPDDLLPEAVTASLGVAGYPDDAAEPEELLSVADRALYRAKADGRNRVAPA